MPKKLWCNSLFVREQIHLNHDITRISDTKLLALLVTHHLSFSSQEMLEIIKYVFLHRTFTISHYNDWYYIVKIIHLLIVNSDGSIFTIYLFYCWRSFTLFRVLEDITKFEINQITLLLLIHLHLYLQGNPYHYNNWYKMCFNIIFNSVTKMLVLSPIPDTK